MIQKTKNYDIFKFRTDNRAVIDKNHVNRIIQSIKTKNLLEFRPIVVNGDMEVIDGQNRLLAAQQLGVDIYYQIQHEAKPQDIILMNIAKSWTNADYLNFYDKNGYIEYQKFSEFLKKNNLSLKIAMLILIGSGRKELIGFRNGEFKFDDTLLDANIAICRKTVDFIKRMNGNFASSYTDSAKFWKALVKITSCASFNEDKWFFNLTKHIHKMTAKVSEKDYTEVMMEIFNWNNKHRIISEELGL